MRLLYVLPFPELGGGNKVVFQHAELLSRLGWEVTVLAAGPRPSWFDLSVRYLDSTQTLPVLPAQDLVVATYWTTLPVARKLALGPVAHFCQGYEGDLEHLFVHRAEIERMYSLPLPTLTVTPHLSRMLLERFGRESRVVHPPLDERFSPRWRWSPRRRPWIAVPGVFEAEVKGIEVALRAVVELRRRGVASRVLRFSTLPLSPSERALVDPEMYLTGERAEVIARALRRCDLMLFPSRAAEGFGLPLLEAMASGVPAASSRIPSTEYFAAAAVELVPTDDPLALADAAEALLHDGERWRRHRRAGLRAAQEFRAERVTPELAEALRWASRWSATAGDLTMPEARP